MVAGSKPVSPTEEVPFQGWYPGEGEPPFFMRNWVGTATLTGNPTDSLVHHVRLVGLYGRGRQLGKKKGRGRLGGSICFRADCKGDCGRPHTICRREDCKGDCGGAHLNNRIADERPDPTGLKAAENVKTTGRLQPNPGSRTFVNGGLPGLGKKQ